MTLNSSALPPMVSGALPVLGHAVEFNKDRHRVLWRGYKEHGSIFMVDFGISKTVVLVGPEYNKAFFEDTDTKLSLDKAYVFLKSLFGEVGLTAPVEIYNNQRPVLYEPFGRQKMLRYTNIIQQTVQEWLDGLGKEGEMDITEEMSNVTQHVAGRTFLGKEFYDSVGEEFWKEYETLGKALDPILPPNLPIPKFIKRDIAKKKMYNTLAPIIKERRNKSKKYDDFLQDLVDKPMADGTFMDDDAIVKLILALMFAGHETTAGQGAWSIIQLLQNPDYLLQVKEEIANHVPYGITFDSNSLANLEKILWAVEETSRIYPAADILIRMTNEEYQIGGYTLPKDMPIMTSAMVSHFLPEFFENPHTYDPTRFGPERNEKNQHRYSTIGFGGSTHKCAGMNFAYNEMIMITALLFQQFDLELLTEDTKIVTGLGACKPCPAYIRYKRKPAEELVGQETLKEAIAGACPHLTKLAKEDKQN